MRDVIELRWDPTLREWIMVSNVRERRPWQTSGQCPFCFKDRKAEEGKGEDVLILPNKYPMLVPTPPKPKKRHPFFRVRRSFGECKVIVETPSHDIEDLDQLPASTIAKVFKAVAKDMSSYSNVKWARYYLLFRNKGKEIGVSLIHPHSQVYILPYIPVKIKRELRSSEEYFKNTGACLFCNILRAEEEDGRRILVKSGSWSAFMPYYAHWPFEVHIYPRRHIQLLTELNSDELFELAKVIKSVLCGMNTVLNKSMPYMMVLHQAPLKGQYRSYHLHIEIYGALRPSGELKYLAGMEQGGGNFTFDSDPEENAVLLREAIKKCDGGPFESKKGD